MLACDARAEFLVAVDIENRSEHALPLVRLYCAIEPASLLDLFPDRVKERAGVEWNRIGRACGGRERSALRESGDRRNAQRRAGSGTGCGTAGRERAFGSRYRTLRRSGQELDQFLARVAFASEHGSIAKLDLDAAFRELCRGLKSFAELKNAGASFIPTLEQRAGTRLLNEIAPGRIRLPNGRQTKVNYEPGKPPWIASRLQDFFGMRETPRIANGKVSLVVHLAGAKQAPRTDHDGPGRLLAASLSAAAAGAGPPLSKARVA